MGGFEVEGFAEGDSALDREEMRTEVVIGLLLLFVSPFLPWFRFYAAGGGDRYGGLGGEFWGIAIPVWFFASVIVVAGLLLKGPVARQVAQITAITAAIVSVCLIGICEIVAALVPGALLPESVRDALFDLRGSFGPWMALIGSLLVILGLSGRRVSAYVARFKSAFAPRSRNLAVIFASIYGAALVLLWWVRHQPWVEVTAGGEWSLPVWISGTPFFGAVSFLAVASLAAAAVGWSIGRPAIAVALAGVGGWVFTFLAALFVLLAIGASALVPDEFTLAQASRDLGVPVPADLVGTDIMEESVEVQISWGAWIAYALGLLSTFAAVAMVRLRSRPWGSA